MEMSKTQHHSNPAKEIWQMLREVLKSHKEGARRLKEIEHIFKVSKLEADQRRQETDRRMQETALQMKETDRRLKKAEALFTTQWGKFMETLVEGDLLKLLKEKNIIVTSTTMNMKVQHQGENWEIDILASNGEEMVMVEVKTTLSLRDVKDFIKKLNTFTSWKSIHRKEKMYGAVAYLKANHGSTQYAEKQGLFVIKATGSSSSIINKKDFQPKVFS